MADETFMEVKREILEGFAYASSSGQIVIDAHPTDEAHLKSRATHNDQPLYRCRHYLRDLIPKEWLGTKGQFLIDRTVTTTGDVVSVQISFVPKS
jgi:hypothetical protein